jgi:hypothetical protein
VKRILKEIFGHRIEEVLTGHLSQYSAWPTRWITAESRVTFLVGITNPYFFHRVQTGPGVDPDSSSSGIPGHFSCNKSPRARRWPLASSNPTQGIDVSLRLLCVCV